MKIIITGASGRVGRLIIPYLLENSCKLLLVGRDQNNLAKQYPQLSCIGYEDLKKQTNQYDLLLHLAAVNNDKKSNKKTFEDGNINFVTSIYDTFCKLKVNFFINVSSIQALDLTNNSYYASTKRSAAKILSKYNDERCKTIFLPYIYDENKEFPGKLGFLNILPKYLANIVFGFVKSLRSTLEIKNLCQYICRKSYTDDADVITDNIEYNFMYLSTKKIIDIIFSISIIILLGWLLLIIWICIKMESPGPGIFSQVRIGIDNKKFVCYKFRTMFVDSKEVPSHDIDKSKITKLGKYLRKYKIDEFPQIINILKNEISLVGPRPCLPSQKLLIKERTKYQVHKLKPGISGLSQIYGVDMSNPKELATWDHRYLKMRSTLLDVKIMINTLFSKIKRPSDI